MPRLASWSRFGVLIFGLPNAPMQSGRKSSARRKRTLGLAGAAMRETGSDKLVKNSTCHKETLGNHVMSSTNHISRWCRKLGNCAQMKSPHMECGGKQCATPLYGLY